MLIGNREFDVFNETYICAVLNVTPDSFFDGGKYINPDECLLRCRKLIEEGADLIDIGGESTRPGAVKVSMEEELARLLPCIEAIKKNFDIPLSIDTYKAEVARQCIELGADMINDISGLTADEKMAEIVVKSDVPCCIMHNGTGKNYTDYYKEYLVEINKMLEHAELAGIDRKKIILDPGVGFGKTTEQNLTVINRIEDLTRLGYATLLGVSNKSLIGNVCDVTLEDRKAGNLSVTAFAAMKNVSFVRVHDVADNLVAIRMVKSIVNEKKWVLRAKNQ